MLDRIRRRFSSEQNLHYNIEYFNDYNDVAFVSGWAFFDTFPVARIYYKTRHDQWREVDFEPIESAGVAKARNNPVASHARFFLRIMGDLPRNILDLTLRFQCGSGFTKQYQEVCLLHMQGIQRGPYQTYLPEFFKKYVVEAKVQRVLEIGSRARSGVNNRQQYIPDGVQFTGIDVADGPGVDIVCDAHKLSDYVEHNTYDVVYSLNVFEHLLMPWKAVLEINKALKPGGVVMIFTHHAYPLHDLPWDYFRFTDNAWYGLLNQATGFEIIQTDLLDPVALIPNNIYEGSVGLKNQNAYIHSAVIARKVSETALSWPVELADIVHDAYPE